MYSYYFHKNGAEESDSEEVDPYQQLVTSLNMGSGTYLNLLRKKQREEAGKEEDDQSDEGDGNMFKDGGLETSEPEVSEVNIERLTELKGGPHGLFVFCELVIKNVKQSSLLTGFRRP